MVKLLNVSWYLTLDKHKLTSSSFTIDTGSETKNMTGFLSRLSNKLEGPLVHFQLFVFLHLSHLRANRALP